MAQGDNLNVFSGPDSISRYFDPDNLPPLPLLELPSKLNPLRNENVRIYAKMLTAHPAQNVKALPALNMLRHEPSAASKSIVEASSGSTVLSLAMAARALYGNDDVCAYVTNKKHPDQLRLLRFFGLKVALYGGLAQQEPHDPKGIMSRLRRLAKTDESISYLGQYDNDHNWKSHERWTGAQIWKQIPKINLFCATVGTGGCITGTGMYLKSQNPSVKVVGVCNAFGDPTPGPRHFPGFESSNFPWREIIDDFEDISSVDSYNMSMQLCREGIIAGPSSGEALCGLIRYLEKLRISGKLSELADMETEEVSCVFICCDLPYQYMDDYFDKLNEDKFPPIINKILLSCDQDKYNESWVLKPIQAKQMLSCNGQGKQRLQVCNHRSCRGQLSCSKNRTSQTTFLDLRQRKDFETGHIRRSLSSPLKDLSPTMQDVFGNTDALHKLWKGLQIKFDGGEKILGSKKLAVIVLCYDGEISQMATSILRAKGYTAFSVCGGFPALRKSTMSRGHSRGDV
ncbi:hypothetical protein MMC22_004900 [Lobaria immixta]|nr:hypothetical protein [Lobaria immixta]